MELEKRFLANPEIRVEGEDAPTIEGYAALFNSMSEDLGGFREVIAPGAFSATLGEDVRALWNHDENIVLGRTRAGTLTIAEDERGLRAVISPPASAAAYLESMRRGDVDQMSFGFRTEDDKWEMRNGEPVRTLLKVRLFDVSVVTYPAYPETSAAVRSLTAFRKAEAPDFTTVRARVRLAEHAI